MHENQPPVGAKAANDNGPATKDRVGTAVIIIAKIIGRQLARDRARELVGANDNQPSMNGRKP